MKTMFNDKDLTDVAKLEPILAAADTFGLGFYGTRKERATWICDRLMRFYYSALSRKKKRILRHYIRAATGLSKKQMKRHIRAYKRGKKICAVYNRHSIPIIYTDADCELLAKVDNATGRLSGNLTAQFCANQFTAGEYIRLQFFALQHCEHARIGEAPRHSVSGIQGG